jgi:hypothetical protein
VALDRILQTDPGIFSAHLVPSGWEVITPSSDPYLPAYWCAIVVGDAGHEGAPDASPAHHASSAIH